MSMISYNLIYYEGVKFGIYAFLCAAICISAKEVMFFAGVVLFVCLLAILLKKLVDFDKIFRIARQSYKEQTN